MRGDLQLQKGGPAKKKQAAGMVEAGALEAGGGMEVGVAASCETAAVAAVVAAVVGAVVAVVVAVVADTAVTSFSFASICKRCLQPHTEKLN